MSVPSAEEFAKFLDEFKAYDIVASPTPFHLVSLKNTDKLWAAVRTMLQRHVSSVAVFNEKKASFEGFVDILDVSSVVFMLNFAQQLSKSLGSEPTWEEFSETELKVLSSRTVEEFINVSERDPWREVAFQANARQLLEQLSPQRGARRVAVKDAGNAGIEGVVSQWDAVYWLQRQLVHAHYFPNTLFKHVVPRVMASERNGRRVVTVSESSSAMDAFTTLTEERVSGVAVIDANQRLVGVLSASDFLRSRRDSPTHEWDAFFDDLRSPVSEYLNRRNAYFPGEYSKAPITLHPKDTVLDVLHKFTKLHIHRLFELDEHHRPVAVWSLSDVLEVFLRYSGVQKAPKKNKDQKKKNKKKNKK